MGVRGTRTAASISVVALLLALAALAPAAGDRERPADDRPGEALYRRACAACHGADGTGAPKSRVAFSEPLPDFTDCSFATREPDADWFAVAHDGGPVRGFSEMMPALGDALTDREIQEVLTYVRGFCPDDDWPRGELNLPRPLVTEKAYPEDEAVVTFDAATEGAGSVDGEVVYERRFGARNQWEVVVPFGWSEREAAPGETDWVGALGDVAIGAKRALFHGLDSGTIFSVAGEVILPTGDEDEGFGKGTVVFEPFVAFGQVLPRGAFLHAQAGAELPADTEEAQEEAFWRAALGASFAEGRFGRTWSPMVEVLGARELTASEEVEWDLLPQLQVTLNTRQHVMVNLGVRVPVTNAGERDTRAMVYLLWDWFDGGLRAGW